MSLMQVPCCTRRCLRLSQVRVLFPKSLHARRFASRPSPGPDGFNTGKRYGAPRSPKANDSGFNATGPSARPKKGLQDESLSEADEVKARPRKGFGPGTLIFLSIAAYLGYEFNKWSRKPARSMMMNPQNFVPFMLQSNQTVSSTCAILTFGSFPKGQNTANVSEAWKKGVWSVQVMQPELQIARPYTPLPPTEGMEPEQVRLFVRREPQGEVSTFLHTIYRGTFVSLRGPRIEYEVPEDVDEVLFLAGGTGIAPALQVAHTLFNHRIKATGESPELRILWANRRREDSLNGLETPSSQRAQAGSVPNIRKLDETPQAESPMQPGKTNEEIAALPQPSQNRLVEEVESLKARHGGKLIVDYLVDEEGSYITESLLRKYLSGTDQTANQDGTPRRKVVVISGPDGFVDVFAGPKAWQGGREIQGPLGGLLKKINPQGWDVWKL